MRLEGLGQVKQVLFRSKEDRGELEEGEDVGFRVVVVIGEGAEDGGADAEGGEGAAEGFGLADAAESAGLRGRRNRRQFSRKPSVKYRAILIIFSDFFEKSLIFSSFFSAGDDDGRGAGQGAEGLAEAALGKEAAAEGIDGIDQDNIEAARGGPVLEAVVEDEEIRSEAELGSEGEAGGAAAG